MAFSKFRQLINHYCERISLLQVILLSCLFAIVSIVNMHGGSLHQEMAFRLPFYMSDTPLLNKIFDSQVLEQGLYRSRELSYLTDFIDSKFIEFSIDNGFPHFLSLTHYLFSIATGCLLWLFCVKEMNLKPLVGIGLLTLFWTSPSIFLGGSFFRTAKIGVAFLTAILFYIIYKVASISKDDIHPQISKKVWILYSISIFFISFFDEQGLFIAATTIVFLTIWSLFVRNKNIYIMLIIGVAGILIHLLYRYSIAPKLTFILNGYRPDFNYQTLHLPSFFKYIDTYLSEGFLLYVDTFRSLIGNPPRAVGYGLLVFFIFIPFVYLCTNKNLSTTYRKLFTLSLLGLLITNLFLMITMNSLMVYRHPALASMLNNTMTYYSLPTNVLLAMTLAVLTGFFYKFRIPIWFLLIVICLGIAGNVMALPQGNFIIRHTSYFQNSSDLLHALKNLDSLDKVNEPLIEKSSVFKYFKSKKKSKPVDAIAYNEKGVYYAELGQYRRAIKQFSKAISLDHNDSYSYHNRGNIYVNLGQYQLTIEDLNKAISLKPEFALSYQTRGLAYIRQGNKELGCSDAQKACSLGECKILEWAKGKKFCR